VVYLAAIPCLGDLLFQGAVKLTHPEDVSRHRGEWATSHSFLARLWLCRSSPAMSEISWGPGGGGVGVGSARQWGHTPRESAACAAHAAAWVGESAPRGCANTGAADVRRWATPPAWRHTVALQLIGHNHPGHVRQPFEELAEERRRGGRVAPALHQDIEHMAVLIHRCMSPTPARGHCAAPMGLNPSITHVRMMSCSP
jgi:hypothetical protein